MHSLKFLYEENLCCYHEYVNKKLCNYKVWDFAKAFQMRKLFGTLKKRAPGESGVRINVLLKPCSQCSWGRRREDLESEVAVVQVRYGGDARVHETPCRDLSSRLMSSWGQSSLVPGDNAHTGPHFAEMLRPPKILFRMGICKRLGF